LVAGHLVTALQGETYQSEIQTTPIEPQQSVQPIEPPSAVHQQSSDDETQLPPKKCHAKGDSDKDFLPSDDHLPELSSDDSDTDSKEDVSTYVRAIPPINSAHSRSCPRNQCAFFTSLSLIVCAYSNLKSEFHKEFYDFNFITYKLF
jgi:hypothetical protein